MHDDRCEQGEGRFESVVNPLGENFAGGIGEAFDFVEVVVVEAFNERVGHFFDVAVVDEVSLGRVDFPFDDDVEPEGVAVEAVALVLRRKGRQVVGGLEAEGFRQTYMHVGPIQGGPF